MLSSVTQGSCPPTELLGLWRAWKQTCGHVRVSESHASSLGILLRDTEKAERLLAQEAQREKLHPPSSPPQSWKAASPLLPMFSPASWSPATPRSAHPLTPGQPDTEAHKFPHRQALHTPSALTSHRNAYGHTRLHTRAIPGQPFGGDSPCLLISTTILWGTWAFLTNTVTCGHTAPLHVSFLDPLPPRPGGPLGQAVSWVFLAYTHTALSSPAKVSISKEKRKSR